MGERSSYSRHSERDNSSERSRSASPSNRDLIRSWFTSSDHQASTSSGLSDTTQSESESQERQRNDRHDPLQKRFHDILAELENRPHVSKEILEEYRQEFHEKANESERKEYIEDLEKQLEINNELGDLLKDQHKELIHVRLSVLEFLKTGN